MLFGTRCWGLKSGFYGWGELGGCVFIWSPELEVGFAYVPTGYQSPLGSDQRSQRILSALFETLSEPSIDSIDSTDTPGIDV